LLNEMLIVAGFNKVHLDGVGWSRALDKHPPYLFYPFYNDLHI
jgi:hypothetical protein